MRVFFIFLFFNVLVLKGQNFEGKLTYVMDIDITMSLKKMGVTKEVIIESMKKEGMWADKIETSYKQGNYYSELQNNQKTKNIYRNDSNKVYTFMEGKNAISLDASVDNEEKITGKKRTVKLLDTLVQIYGRNCKIVRVRWMSGYYDYYFDSVFLKMSSNYYTNYILDGWYDFLEISNSLPLKIVKSTKGIVVTMTLNNVEQKMINEDLFKL